MTTTADAPALTDLASAAADAVASTLPSVDPLQASIPQPGSEHVTAAFAGAALVDLEGAVSGRLGVLVGEDLVSALSGSPMGDLDLAAAVQPALDAAAASLGTSAKAARTVELDAVVGELGGPFTVVPLIGAGIAAALAVPDSTLEAAAAAAAAGTSVTPETAAAPPAAPEAAPALGAAIGAGIGLPDHRTGPIRGIEMLHGVSMEVTVELGRTQLTVRELLALSPGTVLELDRAAGSPADLLVNGRLIARGEVVVVDEDFGLRITEIVDDGSAG
ncbi:MAG TPA: flagellar motor switch protein FliN [Nocardioidaceae bacterium]|nr:flagellar motor switch protein FliN [Nocardioidaceae bacterium]